MNDVSTTLHLLADDGTGLPARPDLADRVLARARQRSRRRGAAALISTTAVVALIAAGITLIGTQQQANRTAPTPAATSSSSGFARARENVLLIGSDAGSDRIGTRPDTIILASIDTRTGATALFGLPRNLQHAPFPPGSAQARAFPHGYYCPSASPGGECMLNALWTWAEHGGAKYYPGDAHPGLTATTQAAEQVTGLSVDDTVVLDMRGLRDLVDAVGGVEVTVRERLPIGGNGDPSSRDYHHATGGWLEPGRRHLNGYQALWFVRSRWSTSDYDRMARQRCLVSALATQVDGTTLLSHYPAMMKALSGSVQTSIAAADLPRWAALVTRMRTADITSIALGPPNTVDPDFAEIRRTVKAALDPAPDADTGTDTDTGTASSSRASSQRC